LDSLMTDTEKRLLYSFLDSFSQNLKNTQRLKGRRLKISIEPEPGEEGIPTSIFSKDIGVLETVVKYLHENQGRSLGEIAGILKRSQNNIAVSYLNSKAKQAEKFRKTVSAVRIPLDIFSKKTTCFESICIHLKDTKSLSFHNIGALLDRDERTIWTIYKRAKKKVKNG